VDLAVLGPHGWSSSRSSGFLTMGVFVVESAFLMALLGGSFGSRITSNIREQKGYTYSPYSTANLRRAAGRGPSAASPAHSAGCAEEGSPPALYDGRFGRNYRAAGGRGD